MISNLFNKETALPNASSFINLAFTTYWAEKLSELFWTRSGTAQRYMNFLLCETDPLFNQQRLAAQIIQIDSETEEATTLWLRPTSRWSGFKPGQFITIECELNGVRLKRNYSISCSPAFFEEHGLISITVKAIDDGKVSNFLNECMEKSQVLHISEAMGSFALAPEQEDTPLQPLLFIAAGSGITPIKSMIEHLVDQIENEKIKPQSAELVYYSNTKEDGIFIQQLQALANRHEYLSVTHRVSQEDGFISADSLQQDCQDIEQRAIYLCGPEGFMQSVQSICGALGVEPDAIQTESFGAAYSTTKGSVGDSANQYDLEANPVTVDFAFANKTVSVNQQKSLLELAENIGLTPKYGCRSGICHECKCQRPQGTLINQMTGEIIPDDQTVVQSCITAPISNVTLEQW